MKREPELLSQCASGDVVRLPDGRTVRIAWQMDLVTFYRAPGEPDVRYLPANTRIAFVSSLNDAPRDAAGDRPGADQSDPLAREIAGHLPLFGGKP